MSTYLCEKCKYHTNKQCDFIKHESTKKHIKNTTIQIENEVIPNICEYCNKEFFSKYTVVTHQNICSQKDAYINKQEVYAKNNEIEQLYIQIAELQKENAVKTDKLVKSKDKYHTLKETYDELKTEYDEFVIKVANKNVDMTSTNNSHNTNTNNYNMQYIIQNFNDTPNFVDRMSEPVSDYERAEILKYGPVHGCSRLIEIRCLLDTPFNQRSIHGLDASRDKFLIRDNDCWIIDFKADKITKTSIDIINQIYVGVMSEIEDPREKTEILNRLIKLQEKTGNKKIQQFLMANTLLQNSNNTPTEQLLV
jgi:hypothetical protein